jgi:phospholipid:diacylglycerol acyltransferase
MPVVIASHSMGSQIVLYFFKWVTTPEELGGGGGGEDWVEKNCAKFVNIAGPMLGVPKAVPALLSGEMKDTAALFGPMGNVMERLFGKKDRRELWTTWGSLWEMLPKGGTDIWGTSHDIITSVLNNDEELVSKYHNSASIDDHDMVCLDDGCSSSAIEHIHSKDGSHLEVQDSLASFITFNDELTSFENESDHILLDAEGIGNNGYRPNDKAWTINDAIAFLIKSGGGYGESLHASRSVSPRPESESWNNPLATPLPSAPSMKMYCLYGVGIETERAYYYRKTIQDLNILNGGSDDEIPTYEIHLPYIMDASVNEPERHVHFGTRSSDGDVSVPLISLGYMCVDKWQNSKTLNPSNINITTREYKHREEFQVNDPMRGGPHSADHGRYTRKC